MRDSGTFERLRYDQAQTVLVQSSSYMFLGSVPTTNEWAKRAMAYIGIKVRLAEQVTILDPDSRGRITLRFGARTVTLPKAVRSLLEEGQNQIVLNLANVNFLDAAGLRELVDTSSMVKDRGGQMIVVQLRPGLTELMRKGRVLRLFDVYENESQAVASFSISANARTDSQRPRGGPDSASTLS